MREASGVKTFEDFAYGRKETTVQDAGSVANIPSPSNYKSNLQAKGFSNEEIVALASIDALQALHAPTLGQTTYFEKLDTSFYKLVGSNSAPGSLQALAQTLSSDVELKTIVDQYAQDKVVFQKHLGESFIKLINLGHEAEELTNIENLIQTTPFYKYK